MKDGITLGLIAKDEAANIRRIHEEMKPESIFTEIVLTDTGSTDNTVELAESYGWRVNIFPWTNHFAEARNANLAQVQTKWYCWMDCDDLIDGAEKIPGLVAEHGQFAGQIVAPYYYHINADGKPTTVITRERIIDLTRATWTWAGRVHETLIPTPVVPIHMADGIIWVHLPQVGREGKIARNLELLTLDFKEKTASPMSIFYMGTQYMAEEKWPEAIAWFKVYIERGDRPDLVWRACELCADCLRYQAVVFLRNGIKERHDELIEESLGYDLRAIEMVPQWADAYFGMAEGYTMLGVWEKALVWHELGLTKERCDPVINQNPYDYNFRPYTFSHQARTQRGDVAGALADVNTALEALPDEKPLLAYKWQYENLLDEKKLAEAALTIARALPDQDIPKLAEALPDVVKKFDDVRRGVYSRVAQVRHVGRPVIDIWCGQTIEAWGPPSLDEGGIGGSETAVIHVARILADKGAQVRVLAQPGIFTGTYGDVGYWDFDALPFDTKRNVLVIWRNPMLAAEKQNAQRTLFWAHDLNYGPKLYGPMPHLDYLCGVSKWHADYLAQTYPALADRVRYVRNGIDLSRYTWPGTELVRDRDRIVWSSSPDRGLRELLAMMPFFTAIRPKMKVHAYYGMNNLVRMAEQGDPMAIATVRETKAYLTKYKEFVEWHGRVDQKRLAYEQMVSGWLIYPTRFTEVSCITLLEAQAAGLDIVASDVAAIKETLNGGGLVVPGVITHPSGHKQFVGETAYWLRNPAAHTYDEQQKKNVQAQTWEKVVEEDWLRLIGNVL